MVSASFILTLWTNDPERAAWADAAGVDRIGLDLETHGKEERQRGLPTWISPHRLDDLERLRPALSRAQVFVRSNPIHDGSKAEIDALTGAGADVIMLPNFTRAQDVERFVDLVAGRARITPLVERVAAIDAIPELPALGIEEIHVGLNDLSIDVGLKNRLEVLTTPTLARIATNAHAAKLRLCVGGLGRAFDTDLPVASDLVYAQQARLGSTGALIARSFFNAGMDGPRFAREITALRERLAFWAGASAAELDSARVALARACKETA